MRTHTHTERKTHKTLTLTLTHTLARTTKNINTLAQKRERTHTKH